MCLLRTDVHAKYTAAVILVVPSLMEHTMHEYTHSHSPFLSHLHPLFTDGGQHTHIDYTYF